MKLETWMRRHTLGIAILAAVDVVMFCLDLALERRSK